MENGLAATAGPRYFGFVTGGALPAAVAADWLTAAWDQNAVLFAASPAAAIVEEIVAGWVLDLLGLPASAGVGLVTGCQMANFTGLAAARHAVLARAGWNVAERGLRGAPPVALYVGAEAHTTLLAALRMLGFGADELTTIEADEQGRMRADALARAMEGGGGPAIVCAQAGNVNTGAFDPLGAIADLAAARGAWLHVDGAFGLWAAVAPARRPLLDGFDRADSWATDAHKWLNVPLRQRPGHRPRRRGAARGHDLVGGVSRAARHRRSRPARLGARSLAPRARLRALRRAPLARPARRRRPRRALLLPGGAHGRPARRRSPPSRS